jgi:hypothetical protein
MARYDLDGLKQIEPAMAVAYLSGTGWKVQDEAPTQVRVKHQNGADPVELTVPRDPSKPDYGDRMAEIVDCLQQVEKRPTSAILTDLLFAGGDILRICVHTSADRALSLTRCVALMQGTQKLLSAAAWGHIDPAPYFTGKKPSQVAQYVKTAQIGQTEGPGFVAAVIVPLNEADEDSLPRRVTRSLALILHELEAINTTPTLFADGDHRRKLINEGLSANLCDGLVHLFGRQGGKRKPASRLDLRFRWSPLVSVPKNTPSEVCFESDAVPMLMDLATLLRETTPKEDFQLKGVVTDLKRRDTGGRIVVNNVKSDTPDKVTIELEDELYDLAIQAHREKREVTCVGTLVQNRASFKLEDASLASGK